MRLVIFKVAADAGQSVQGTADGASRTALAATGVEVRNFTAWQETQRTAPGAEALPEVQGLQAVKEEPLVADLNVFARQARRKSGPWGLERAIFALRAEDTEVLGGELVNSGRKKGRISCLYRPEPFGQTLGFWEWTEARREIQEG